MDNENIKKEYKRLKALELAREIEQKVKAAGFTDEEIEALVYEAFKEIRKERKKD